MFPPFNSPPTAWGAVILAGGHSRRMGVDKGSLRLHGKSFVERLAATFQSSAVPLVLVDNGQVSASTYPQALRVLHDHRIDAGPLEGIRVGLAALQPAVELAFVISCDSPLLKIEVVEFLVKQIGAAQAAVPRDETQIYGTTAVYRTDLHSMIDHQLAQGQHSIKQLLNQLNVHFVAASELRSIDAELVSLLNVNTPEEFSRLVKMDPAETA